MKKIFLSLFIVWTISLGMLGQVTIGTGTPPLDGVVLDLKEWEDYAGNANSTRGVTVPRVFLTDINNLFPMLTGTESDYETGKLSYTGMVVYNTNITAPFEKGLYVWNGVKWIQTYIANNGLSIANNGLSMSSDTVKMGGDLIQNTVINLGSYNLDFSNTIGKVRLGGTGNPSVLLDIESGISGVLKIADGTQASGKVLTSDINGIASWQSKIAQAYEQSTVNQSSINLDLSGTSNFKYINYSIVVPPGRSVVSAGIVVYPLNANANGYVTFALSTSDTQYLPITNELVTPPTSVRSTPQYSGFSVMNNIDNLGQVTWYVNNTTNSNQTLYVYVTGGNAVTRVYVRGTGGFKECFIYCAY